jgi:outer membrane protein OmpA-like peptidoglycan-associated protein
MSPQGEQVWRGIAANTKVPPPMPCLKCAPPKRQIDDTDFLFEEGSSKLDAKALEEIAALAKQSTERVIEIVAHADASEPKPAELAKARADAVAAALKAKGVAVAQLRIVVLGASLPLSNDKAQNRRVETALLYGDEF